MCTSVLILAAVGFFLFCFVFALSSVILNLKLCQLKSDFKSFMFQIVFDSVQVLSVREGTPTELCQGRGIDFNFSSAKG